MSEIIEPNFACAMDGYTFLGRGPSVTGASGGWAREPALFYRCAVCGGLMCAAQNDYFTCSCGAMHLDIDAGRFGSRHGDENILVYRKDSKVVN